MKYFNEMRNPRPNYGYINIITNPQSTLMYANCIDNVIYCYSLDSTETSILFISFIKFHIISDYRFNSLVHYFICF